MPKFVTRSSGEAGPGAMDLNDVNNYLGFGKFQWRLLFICGLGWMVDATEGISISFLFITLPDEFGLNQTDLAAMPMALAFGMMVGGFFFGRVADIYGRKVAYVTTVLITATAGVCQAFVSSYEQLVLLKLVAGFGLGGNLPVDFSMFSEFTPTEQRSKFLPILSCFWSVGELFACLLAVTVLANYGWRTYILSYSCFGYLILFLRRNIPESPRFLLVRGRHEEMWTSLKYVAKTNGRTLDDDATIIVDDEEQQESRVLDLFSSNLWLTTTILFIAWSTGNIMYYGMFFYLPEYLQAAGGEDESDPSHVYEDVAKATLAQIPGCLVTILMLDTVGRRVSLVIGSMGTVVFMWYFGLLLAQKENTWLLVGSVMAIKFFQAIAYVTIYTYTTEVYPTSVRATGIGSCTMIKQLSVLSVPLLGAVFMDISPEASVFFFAGMGLFGTLWITQLPIETAGQGLNDSLGTVNLDDPRPTERERLVKHN